MAKNVEDILREWSITLTKRDQEHLISVGLDGLHFFRNMVLDLDLLHAALEYWDPKTHCFRFGYDEICPTPEEFAAMFGLPQRELATVPTLREYYYDEFRDYFHLGLGELDTVMVGQEVYLERFALRFHSTSVKRDPISKRRAYLFCMIHKFLLLSGVTDVGLACVQSVVEQIEGGRNPMPLVLGETLMCIDALKKNPNAPLKGSPLLLQTWLLERLSFLGEPNDWDSYTAPCVLQRSRRFPLRIGRDKWRLIFAHQDYTIRWVVPWWKIHKMVGINNVPYCRLPSLSVLTFYYPSRIMRQYGMEQVIPKKWENPTSFPLRSGNVDRFEVYWLNRPTWPVLLMNNSPILSKRYKEWLDGYPLPREVEMTKAPLSIRERLGEKKAHPKERLSLGPKKLKAMGKKKEGDVVKAKQKHMGMKEKGSGTGCKDLWVVSNKGKGLMVAVDKEKDVGTKVQEGVGVKGKEIWVAKNKGKEVTVEDVVKGTYKDLVNAMKETTMEEDTNLPIVTVTTSMGSLIVKETVDEGDDGKDRNWKRVPRE